MVMKNEYYIPASNGKNQLHVISWCEEEKPIAILQLSHGMVEFIDRYDGFATYMAKQGFYVIGNDHLGHGKSVITNDDWGYFNEKDASDTVVEDLYLITKQTKEQYPDLPYFVLGHSMGSFFIRKYTIQHGEEVDGVVIMGTGNQSKGLVKCGKMVTKLIKRMKGERYRSKFLDTLMFGSFNKRIKEKRTDKDWLTRDNKIVDWYINEPACNFLFTINGIETLLDTVSYVTDTNNINKFPKELPLLFVSGKEDPVGEYGRAVERAYNDVCQCGCKDVSIKLYDDARHEILNEMDHDVVYRDIHAWLMNLIQ